MSTIYYTATTLDGFLADPDDSLDWLFRQNQEDGGPFGYEAFIANVGAIAMGATTYEWVRSHLAASGEPWPYKQPTWVFTHRDLPLIDGADVRLTNGAVDRVHADLTRAADGTDVWIVGGGALAADFARAGLLDEIVVSIAPVTLGAGRPLLSGRFDLQLLDTGRNVDFVCARYRVVGLLTEDLPDGE